MVKVSIFFEDLKKEKQAEIYNQLGKELKEEIKKKQEEYPHIYKEQIRLEMINSYLNTHNFTQTYEI